MEVLSQYFLNYLPDVLAALAVLIVGILIAQLLKKLSTKWIQKQDNPTIQAFVVNFVYILALLIVVIITLSKLGVPTATLITVLGAASLAIGLALKDFLSNVAAGFLIILLRPFKIGDYINVSDHIGTVTAINLFVVQLKTTTNEALFIPNNKVANERIINLSYYPDRRLNLSIGVSYDANIEQAKSILAQLLADEELVHLKPEPLIAVQKLADSSIELIVRAWVNKKDYLTAQYRLLENIKQQFDQHGITIPFPQTDVHIKYDETRAC